MKKSLSSSNLMSMNHQKPVMKRVVSNNALMNFDNYIMEAITHTSILNTMECEIQYVGEEKKHLKEFATCIATPPDLNNSNEFEIQRSRYWLELSQQCSDTAERYNRWLQRTKRNRGRQERKSMDI